MYLNKKPSTAPVKSDSMNKEDEETKKRKFIFFRALLNAGFKDITNDIYPEKNYSEKELSCYTNIMKRAFKKVRIL